MEKIILCGSGNLLLQSLSIIKLDTIYKVYLNKTADNSHLKIKKKLKKFKIDFTYVSINKDTILLKKYLDISKIISLQYKNIISHKIIDLYKNKIFNIHFSYLPINRGCYPIAWSILNNDEFSGVTLHRVDEGIDTGNIILQEKIKIAKIQSAKKLYEQSIKIGCQILKKFLSLQNYKEYKQNEKKSSYYSNKSIDFSSIYIDWNKKFNEILIILKALNFEPYQLPKTKFMKDEIYINEFTKFKYKKFGKSGSFKILNKFLLVNCKDYAIKIKTKNSFELFKKNVGYFFYI